MYRLNMSLQIPRMSSLIYTWITRIFDFFMYVQTAYESLCGSLMVTMIIRIFDLTLLASTVYQAKQKLKNISQGQV